MSRKKPPRAASKRKTKEQVITDNLHEWVRGRAVIKPRRPVSWRVERIETTPGLYRLIGPLAKQKGHQKTLCVAIGSKRLLNMIEPLNAAAVEI